MQGWQVWGQFGLRDLWLVQTRQLCGFGKQHPEPPQNVILSGWTVYWLLGSYAHSRTDFPTLEDYNRYLNEKYERSVYLLFVVKFSLWPCWPSCSLSVEYSKGGERSDSCRQQVSRGAQRIDCSHKFSGITIASPEVVSDLSSSLGQLQTSNTETNMIIWLRNIVGFPVGDYGASNT